MKALTLTQPWATLVAIGAKKIETRSWPTKYRGRIAIHSGVGLRPVGGFKGLARLTAKEPFLSALDRYVTERWWHCPLPVGAILATAELYDVRSVVEVVDRISENELCFGDYTPGRYAWLLRDIERFPEPIEIKGALGLWEWNI